MEIIKQIEAKDKAFKVIDSCISPDHFNNTLSYLNHYNHVFDDMVGYEELFIYLRNKMEDNLRAKIDNYNAVNNK